MRRVDDEAGLAAALERAKSEALAAFGDDTVYLEKYLAGPRHIEIQILADRFAKTLHLGERECSIQRRHQKLVEEAPAYGMTEAVRAAMGDAAVRAARAVGYVGAGTCEFMMDASGAFYFLEMNTRIQVEHPVTEAVTGLDLVALQLRIAAGEPIPFEQADVRLAGHAIEARIYAEDPDGGFIPSPGRILAWQAPVGPGIRLDAGFEAGQTVTPHYDAMLAKLIASGRDRDEALDRLARALEDFWIAGIKTGIPFLRRLVRNDAFRKGAYDTGLLEAELARPDAGLAAPGALSGDLALLVVGVVAWRALIDGAGAAEATPDRVAPSTRGSSGEPLVGVRVTLPKQPAQDLEVRVEGARGADRDGSPERASIRVDGRTLELEIAPVGADAPTPRAAVVFDVRLGAVSARVSLVGKKPGDYEVGLRDRVLRVKAEVRTLL